MRREACNKRGFTVYCFLDYLSDDNTLTCPFISRYN